GAPERLGSGHPMRVSKPCPRRSAPTMTSWGQGEASSVDCWLRPVADVREPETYAMMLAGLWHQRRLLPALANAMATACLIAFFFVGGWLVPIDPSFFPSSTSVLILLLTTDWLDPFLSGMIFLPSTELTGRAFHQSWRYNQVGQIHRKRPSI